MSTETAAAEILASLRDRPSTYGTPAALFCRIGRCTRAAAFRLLSKRGLIEVQGLNCEGGKLWRISPKGAGVQPGEELSAIL